MVASCPLPLWLYDNIDRARGTEAILTLDDLLTEAGLAPFRAALEAKSCWHFPVERGAAVQGLLPWKTIEHLVGHNLVPRERFRVLVNGHELATKAYRDNDGQLIPDVVQDLATQGATLAINGIDALIPALGQLSAAMERELRCKINVNCYLTFGAASAFLAHCDAHDILILQIYGAKHWRRFGIPFAFPMEGRRPTVAEPVWEGMMRPGNLLFLPRGEVHAAIPETRPSVHLTFGLHEPTGVDLVKWFAAKAMEVESLRRGLAPTLTGEARRARDRELEAALHELLKEATVEAFFADQDRERAPQPIAPLRMAFNQASQFQPETVLISALRRRLNLATGQDEEAVLMVGKRRIRLSNLSRRALTEITAQGRLTVADLARSLGLTPADKDFIFGIEELARTALIAIAD